MHLLDVNVLIALCDPAHSHAVSAQQFFRTQALRDGWATCPITQNGFLRILGSRKYPGGPGSPLAARPLLAGIVAAPGHQFWPDDVSLLDRSVISGLPESGGLPDIYLLALAVKRAAFFVTFDAGIDASAVVGGGQALRVLR